MTLGSGNESIPPSAAGFDEFIALPHSWMVTEVWSDVLAILNSAPPVVMLNC